MPELLRVRRWAGHDRASDPIDVKGLVHVAGGLSFDGSAGTLVAFSGPGGQTLLASVVSTGIRRWDAATGALLPAVAGGPDNTIFWVATSGLPYGRVLLAGAGNDRAVYRWDADTGQPVEPPPTVIATAQATGTVAIQPLPVTTS